MDGRVHCIMSNRAIIGLARTLWHGSTFGGMSFEWGDKAPKGIGVRASDGNKGVTLAAVSSFHERCCASGQSIPATIHSPHPPSSYL